MQEHNFFGVNIKVIDNKVDATGKTREEIVRAVEYAISEGFIDNTKYVFFNITGEDGEENAYSY